jgi:hypothetical protein
LLAIKDFAQSINLPTGLALMAVKTFSGLNPFTTTTLLCSVSESSRLSDQWPDEFQLCASDRNHEDSINVPTGFPSMANRTFFGLKPLTTMTVT